MPTAARWPCAAPSSLSSSRLGLISACATGSRLAHWWWSTTITSSPAARASSSASNACAPQSTQTATLAPLRLQLDQRFARGAVALHQPVGDVDHRLGAEPAQQQHQQRRAGRPVDVIVAEDRDRLALLDRVGEALRALVHVLEAARVGQEIADAAARGGAAGRRARRRAPAAARRPARPCRGRARAAGASATADRLPIGRC